MSYATSQDLQTTLNTISSLSQSHLTSSYSQVNSELNRTHTHHHGMPGHHPLTGPTNVGGPAMPVPIKPVLPTLSLPSQSGFVQLYDVCKQFLQHGDSGLPPDRLSNLWFADELNQCSAAVHAGRLRFTTGVVHLDVIPTLFPIETQVSNSFTTFIKF